MGAGIADPGILRWMGKYYLYATKVTEDDGLRCWESSDLVNWTYKGFCLGKDSALDNGMAWSPGPFYYNGTFYLYVCGPDQKHKVFAAQSPTGPFKCVNTDLLNVNTLDAVPFLDDDGKLYLFYAGWNGIGIQYREVSSPINADGVNHQTKLMFSADNNGNYWTEGPSMYKHNGTYYLTYCGNDWLRDSYQVQAAKGRTIETIRPQETNPLLVHDKGTWVATGCNWIIRGPDIKSVWNVYHCRKFGGHERRLCLDSLYFDNETGDLRGKVTMGKEQPNPALPDWQDSFQRNRLGSDWRVLSGDWSISRKGILAGDSSESSSVIECTKDIGNEFAAEFNVRFDRAGIFGSDPSYGLLLQDKQGNSLVLGIEVKTKSVEARYRARNTDSAELLISNDLPEVFDLKVWHKVIVESKAGRLKLYFDDMLKIEIANDLKVSGFSLYTDGCRAEYGWMGFSNY